MTIVAGFNCVLSIMFEAPLILIQKKKCIIIFSKICIHKSL